MPEPYTSQCLCGGVRFTVTSSSVDAMACYCGECRKVNGVIGRVAVYFTQQSIKLESPGDHISVFTYSDGANGKLKDKMFCKRCGVTILTSAHGVGNISFWPGPQCMKGDDTVPQVMPDGIDSPLVKSPPSDTTNHKM
ncbi:Mss4-like protein [Cladorrhinum sp. PSN332]|nr:Mss4-like protein [Cladorrhinum sp. PSN332]